MKHWVLRNGQPVSTDDAVKWATWYGTSGEERRVARTVVSDGVEVSTVFLAIDHAFGGMVPILWETLVFGGPLDGEMERYSSREGAEAGHEAMVKRAREAAPCDS